MIEIKIPTSAASLLLLEKMQHEFEMRQKAGLYTNDIELFDLNYRELFEIAEIAAADLVLMLPMKLLLEKNNLHEIIAKSIRTLSKTFNYSDFENYSNLQAKKLLNPVIRIVCRSEELKTQLLN